VVTDGKFLGKTRLREIILVLQRRPCRLAFDAEHDLPALVVAAGLATGEPAAAIDPGERPVLDPAAALCASIASAPIITRSEARGT
jgi:hypothetical protein